MKTANALLDQVLAPREDTTPPRSVTGLLTGLSDLDHITHGLQRGSLTLLASRPSMGKTMLALHLAQQVATQEHLPVAYFSMDIDELQLTGRLAANAADASAFQISKGNLSPDEHERVQLAVEQLRQADLYLDMTTDIHSLVSQARAVFERHGRLGLVVVDYLQRFLPYIEPGLEPYLNGNIGAHTGPTEALQTILHQLNGLAQEFNCAVLVLWQLGTEVEQRDDKRPVVGDLALTELMERNVSMVLMLYRDDFYNPMNSSAPCTAEIHIGKQKNGPNGMARTLFLPHLARFKTLA